MNENPEGTPNPLNPGFGIASTPKPEKKVEETAAGTGMLDYTEAPAPAPAPKPLPQHRNQKIVDPMMRPVSHQPADNIGDDQNFDTLEMEDVSIEELTSDTPVEPISTPIDTPVSAPVERSNFEPKNSIVEPAGKKGSKKKVLIIGAIILIMTAIICGAAAIAIALMNNGGDKVTKAINKLLDGGMPSIVSAQGEINYSTPDVFDASINFDGAFNLATTTNKINAKTTVDYPNDAQAIVDISELTTGDGDTYFKISGLRSVLEAIAPATIDQTETAENVSNCVGSTDVNCGEIISETTTLTTTAGLLSIYGNLIDNTDDQWILISGDFGESMEGLNIFDNSSTCLISAFKELPTYGKDLVNKYKANSFITYSTSNLKIAKVKNDLYKIGFDSDKTAAFINSLSGSGFMNELNSCINGSAATTKCPGVEGAKCADTITDIDASADTLKQVFDGFPTVYVEIDDNYNFTRVYFDTSISAGDDTYTAVTADINLSYPSKIEINEPTEYVNMSTLLNNLMTNVLTSGENSMSGGNNTNQ